LNSTGISEVGRSEKTPDGILKGGGGWGGAQLVGNTFLKKYFNDQWNQERGEKLKGYDDGPPKGKRKVKKREDESVVKKENEEGNIQT